MFSNPPSTFRSFLVFLYKKLLFQRSRSRSRLPSGLELNRNVFLKIRDIDNKHFHVPGHHAQVLSPGRSGTRWLANVLIECTKEFVCHSSSNSLATISYLLHQGHISRELALGSYYYTRYEYFALANAFNKYFIDLDCKNTLFAPLLCNYNKYLKFIVMIRDPIEFIRSGLSRGYFSSAVNPQRWGHLQPLDQDIKFDSPNLDRITKIAFMWNSYASIANSVYKSNPDRFFFLNLHTIYNTPSQVSDLLVFLGIEQVYAPSRCVSYFKKANISKSKLKLNTQENSFLNSQFLQDFVLRDLTPDFTAKILQ